MEMIYEIISQEPKFYVWVFGLVNVLWGIFLFFNKKRHQRELVALKQSLDLDLERRKKVFEMKTTQYEDYFKSMDELHKRHQHDYQEIMLPIINEFLAAYQRACDANDTAGETEAAIAFREKVSKLTKDGFNELQVIRSQTNTLRLTASDKVAALLDELQDLYEQLFQLSSKLISDMVSTIIEGDQVLAIENQRKLNELGDITKAKSLELRNQMRLDLKVI